MAKSTKPIFGPAAKSSASMEAPRFSNEWHRIIT